ncbi:MAG: SAM-dependent DNA methyltransferase [Candidatus Nitrosopelagicus sp.]|jgi:type I restriction enzyme M protein|nr:SAM-dependent DNA methyltransferase [Candidatus Nitrosopelagicus sp.]
MAAKKSTKKEQSFEDKLWDTAELLRGKVAPSAYKDIALGLLFLKFISYWFDQRRVEIKENNKDASEKELDYLLNLKDSYSSKGVFFLKEGDKWDDLVKVVSSEKNLAIKVDNMIQEIENDNQELENVLPKVFAQSNIKNDNLHQLIETFDSIPTHNLSKDSFGRIYEYFLKMFHKKSGEKGGEFFTPESIVQLLVEIIEPYEGIIYDPTCGSGGMFVQSYKFLQAHQNKNRKGISVYGVESRSDIWRICKMNLAMRGIEAKNITNADCLIEHPYEKVKANHILANPPFLMGAWGHEKLKDDVRFAKYGTPSSGKPGGDYAFMSHMIHHLDEKDGKIGLVLDNGSMSIGGNEGKIREKIVKDDLIDCMIALPKNLFYTVTIPACLWFITKNKDDGKTRKRKGETLFIDANKIFTSIDRAHNELSIEQIQKIVETYRSFLGKEGYPRYKDLTGYCKIVKKEEIVEKNSVLTPGRYVGTEDITKDGKPFEDEMKRLTSKYTQLSKESVKLDIEIRKNLKGIGFEI